MTATASRVLALATLTCATLLPTAARAVDGVTVTVHWEGDYDGFWGGFGSVWRHDIEASVAVAHTEIHPGPARMVVLSPDATRVAFIKEGGVIATMPIAGGEATDLVQGHDQGCLDWPLGDWVYYNLGGYNQWSTSQILRRVNVSTGADEAVIEFSCSIWRFHISHDLSRAVVRDTGCFGGIVAYDMTAGDGVLHSSRVTDAPSCSTGFDPEGVYFIDGYPDHSGVDIRRWDNLEVFESFTHDTATTWGGPDSGDQHDRNGWSTNSQDWMCIHLGWGIGWDPVTGWGTPRGANQVLYNWVDQERIVVTSNVEDSEAYDSAGDFWVSGAVLPDAGVVDGNVADTSVLPDAGAPDAASPDRGPNLPPLVDAGQDQQAALGSPVLLAGEVSDDGQPWPEPSVAWTQVSGPGSALFATPDAARCMVSFDALGTYVLRLSADDGEHLATDEVTVTVAEPSIELLAPAGGEVWNIGYTEQILWSATLINDVTIAYSIDAGATWEVVEFSVDRASPQWGRYDWVIPDTPSRECLVMISPYGGGGVEARSAETFTIRTRPAQPDSEAHEVGLGCGCALQRGASDATVLLALGLLLLARRRRGARRG